jgi:hypothetical protein
LEHDTFGPLAHRRIRDLGPRREALLGQDLSSPDDRHVGRFADPPDFLRQFGQPFMADPVQRELS